MNPTKNNDLPEPGHHKSANEEELRELTTIIKEKLSVIKFNEAYKWLFDTDKQSVDSWSNDIVQLITKEIEKAKVEAYNAGKLDAAKHLKKYMISTSPFIARIVDPYIEELSKLQEEQE